MPNDLTWFTISADEEPFRIQGDRRGTPFEDGSYTFDIKVKADGLVIKTRKSIDPRLVQNFVDQVKSVVSSQGTTNRTTAELRSAVVADFDLSIEFQLDVGHLSFKLFHPHGLLEWRIDCELDLSIDHIRADAGP